MTTAEIEMWQQRIDAMSHEQLAHLWRFAPSGHPLFDRDLPLYDYYKERFDRMGGWTPQVSKAVGYGR